MNTQQSPIQQLLCGDNAFYKSLDYRETTKKELTSPSPLEHITYIHTTESPQWRLAKTLFSIIIFPIGLYQLIHRLAANIILPSTNPSFLGLPSNHANLQRTRADWKGSFKVKRISIQVDNHIIDAAIIGKQETLQANKRWVLAAGGNAQFYENKLPEPTFRDFLTRLEGNAIVFNYPGVGASTGMPSREAMKKAYLAMLRFLEDKEKGIGAKEIIGFGHSIGGGVQGDALLDHELQKDIAYTFVNSRSFSDLSTTAANLNPKYSFSLKCLGLFVKLIGWNISSIESSKKLKAPEIILQTATLDENETFIDLATTSNGQAKIIHDDVIPKQASLAKTLLESNATCSAEKFFMGIHARHNTLLNIGENAALVKKINEMLAKPR